MAHLYTTKALGRVWVPSPSSSPTTPTRAPSRGRFEIWPTSDTIPRQRPQQHVVQEGWFHDLRILRGRLAERLGVLLALFICATFLIYHRDRLITPGVQVWTQSFHRLRLGGSLIPPWNRVDWGQYAYVTYATTPEHVCNSVMLAESLHRLGAKPHTLILYAAHLPSTSKPVPPLLLQARAQYHAQTEPVSILSTTEGADPAWAQSLTKLLAFNQTRYTRVLSLDSDATLLRPMDELFLLPREAKIALPAAYWLNATLCTALMLASPSAEEFARVQARVAENREGEYDMDVVNALYGESALVIPHRPYLLLTGELRETDHARYMGSPGESSVGRQEVWRAREVAEEAKYVHFSDWPVPKPWVPSADKLKMENAPTCRPVARKEGVEDCEDRDVWMTLYEDFRRRRKSVCGPEFSEFEQAEEFLKNLPPVASGMKGVASS